MKRCANCASGNADDAAMCANCGATLPPSGSPQNKPRDGGGWVGCLFVLVAVLDVLTLPFVLLSLWPVDDLQIGPPLWGRLAYFAFQAAILALMIYYHRTAVKRGAGEQTRSALVVATVISAIFLGLGTACTVSVFRP